MFGLKGLEGEKRRDGLFICNASKGMGPNGRGMDVLGSVEKGRS